MNLRVAVDARPLASPLAGIGRYTLEIVSRLINAGVDCFLYSYHPIRFDAHSHNVRIRSASKTYPLVSTPFAQTVFSHWAKCDGIDVFWSPRHHLPLVQRTAPSVVTVHDLVWKAQPRTMIRMGRLTEQILMPPSLRKAARVITDSASTADELKNHFPNVAGKIRVVPLAPTYFDAAETAPTSGDDFILFVGTIEPRKNLPRLIEAYRLLRAGGTTTHRLVIAGGQGWKDATIVQNLQSEDVAPYVDVLGRVSDAQLASLYARCAYLVLPSLYEGFGLPILEAMAFGKPVITSNLSSMPEVAGDAALLVDPLNVQDLSRSMALLLDDRKLYCELSRRARAHANRFTWDRTAQETLAVLEEAATDAADG